MIRVLALLALGHGQDTATDGGLAQPDGPYLAWSFRSQPIPGEATERWWFQESVTWTSAHDQPLWRVTLPKWMRSNQCRIGNAEAEGLRRFPRGLHNASFLIGLLPVEGALLIAEPSGLLALSEKDGAVLLEVPTTESAVSFSYDQGTYTIVRGQLPACTGPTRSSGFLVRCGERLYAFDGRVLTVLAQSPLRVLGQARFEERHRTARSTKGALFSAELSVLDTTVRIDAIDFLR